MKSVDFIEQTPATKINLKKQRGKNKSHLKKLTIHLQRLPDLKTQWTIVNKTSLFPAKNTPKTMKHSSRYPSKRKRGLGHPFPGPQTKKIDVHPASLISTLSWETEGKHLMNQFRLLKINDNLEGILKPFHPRSLNERTALVHNNYAITLIEGLCTPHLSIPHAKARDVLIRAKKQFIQSAHCYTQAGLLKQKGKIIACINHITASLEKLSRFVNPNAQETAHVQTPKKYTFRKKSEMNNQTPYYLTRTFFKRLSVEAILPTTNALDYSY
ncbi:hypothetical protein [Rickettsiella grylli]|uniref:hypothetical protein n=1 Tax=Rickettsiella grylli TaxID=59196 RepID=UPI000A4F7122|nr:hypothetical protein [Rickettsiella grylli]